MSKRKIGALTPCFNEEATIIFCVASLLPHVDKYVVVDSGSTDKTLSLLYSIFDKEISDGRLHVIEYGKLKDFDISRPKNVAIEWLRTQDIDYFIRLDADDVFYNCGAKEAVDFCHSLDDSVTIGAINHWEMYQYEVEGTKEWLMHLGSSLLERDRRPLKDVFYCLRIPSMPRQNRYNGSYGGAYVYKADGAYAAGKWTDEARGFPAENIHNSKYTRRCVGNSCKETIVHYGWARPLRKKREKGAIWYGVGKEEDDVRVNRLHLSPLWTVVNDWNVDKITYAEKYWPKNIIFPFDNHPEVIEKFIQKVYNIIGEK